MTEEVTQERRWCVYIHTSPSNKKYVGITSMENPEDRWRRGKAYNHNRHFTNAVNKYGWDNFEHEIVATDLSEQEAQEMERELIAKYDTFKGNNGYNQTSGGEVGKELSDELRQKQSELAKKMWEDEDFKQRMSEFAKTRTGDKNPNYGNHKLAGENNPMYGKRHTEETRRKISAALSNPSDETRKKMSDSAKERMTDEYKERLRQASLGRCHSEESKLKMSESQKLRWTEEARAEASERMTGEGNNMYGKHHSEETKQKLREMFSGENGVWYGKHLSDEMKQKIHDGISTKRATVQLTLEGEYVGEHESLGYAAKAVGAPSEAWICACCQGKALSAYGYIWKYKEDYDPNEKIVYKHPVYKAVVQLSENWEFIARYDRVAEAGRVTGAKPQNIGAACRNGKMIKGSHWLYEEDYQRMIEDGTLTLN